jgi:DNA-binding NarL/FixJ family response regulator
MTIRIGLVDDHPVVLGGLHAALASIPDFEIAAQATTLADARGLLVDDDLDVVLLDVRLPDGNGIAALAEREARPKPAVIVLSSFMSNQYVGAALRFGANGFLLKTAPLDELVEAIRRVAGGGAAFTADQLRVAQSAFVNLTPREREVLGLVLEGRSNEEIGGAIGVAKKTVEQHLTNLFDRYGVSTRIELAMRAEREGWLDVAPAGQPTGRHRVSPDRQGRRSN